MSKLDSGSLTEVKKWLISLQMMILFLILAGPWAFKLTNAVSPIPTASAEGCPTIFGLVLHSVVFALIVRLLMLIPSI